MPISVRRQSFLFYVASKFERSHTWFSNSFKKLFQNLKHPLKALESVRIKKNNLKMIKFKLKKTQFVISWPTYDWNIPLKQRPQHIAEKIAKFTPYSYVFCTKNIYDKNQGINEITEGLYLTNDFWAYAKMASRIHVYSTDPNLTLRQFKKIEKLGIPIIYEILDEINTDLQGGNVKKTLSRHTYALNSIQLETIIITAQGLKNGIPKTLHKKISYIPNACDPEHFQLQHIPKKESVIGYFGALASWFDYELIRYSALQNPNWSFLLIGIDYDGSLAKSRILNLTNIEYLGVVDYEKLPSKIQFSVAVLPFILNDITLGTSPIKIFEYLASGFPVISAALPECLGIEHVAKYETREEFNSQIMNELRNDTHTRRMERREYAMGQTWESRALAYFPQLEEVRSE